MKSLFVEPLLGEQEALALVTPNEAAAAQSLRPESRRREFLTWRAIVRRELGADVQIGYNAVGAPVVGNRDVHIGVSHSCGRVAVCICDTPCAVDIESKKRNFERVAARYMTGVERGLSDDPVWPAVVWSAKETLYKFAGRTELDLLCDLHLMSVDLAAGRLTGCIENGEPVELSVSFCDEWVVVYIV